MKRHKPMARSSKPMGRGQGFQRKAGDLDGALKSYHGFRPRKKPMGPGKKKLAKDAATVAAILSYFDRKGWLEEDGHRLAPCQITGDPMPLELAHAHHKTPRSEMRKAGIKDLDAPHRLIIVNNRLHLDFIHRGMGRPKDEDRARRFALVEHCEQNAENALVMEWGAQDALDLDRLRRMP